MITTEQIETAGLDWRLRFIDPARLDKPTDQRFIAHLKAVHGDGGKPLNQMWPCFQERLKALADAQAE